jgi:hypothetical protein
MKTIATAGNVTVPALRALEALGCTVSVERSGPAECWKAERGDENYLAEDPVALLGLMKLIETRSWDWHPEDTEIDDVIRRYELG